MKTTADQRRRWKARARTLHVKASELFTDMENAGLKMGDYRLDLAGDAMCSAAELSSGNDFGDADE